MERLMQYVWQHRLLMQTDLVTTSGQPVSIIDPGMLNTGAGPDFFNAKVKIGADMWAGDVELHVRASDWHRHGHDGDPAYGSVVLHVVDSDDCSIARADGEVIPQMVMRCEPQFHVQYAQLVDNAPNLPCAAEMASMPGLIVTDWLTALAYERAYAKAERLMATLDEYTGDWEQTGYVLLARALGFNINSEPMERLARSLPLHFLRKHADSPQMLEALFFGQAGMLAEQTDADPYVTDLKREYRFLAQKFSLKPPQSLGWKMGRMRPQNLPYRRIALLVSILATDSRMVGCLMEMRTPDEAVEFFRRKLTGYWVNHYTLDTPSATPAENLSRTMATVLVINVVVPLMLAYGIRHADDERTVRAFEWLQALPPESNAIVNRYVAAGLPCRDAFTSQAILQLRRAYCEPRRCLYCRLGHRLLAMKARRRPGFV